jgi:quinol monooxygenase YgiN
MFARHKVNDYSNWKRIYDDLASMRQEKGVTGAAVYRDANDPKTITVTHQFKDMDTATAFANSEELKSAMQNAGVAGPPDIWFTEKIEQTPH